MDALEMEQFLRDNLEVLEDERLVFRRLGECVDLRNKYLDRSLQSGCASGPGWADDFRYRDGVYRIRVDGHWMRPSPGRREFCRDYRFVVELCRAGEAVTLCFRRLENLRHGFMVYRNLLSGREKREQMSSSHSDYYRVVKVDTHVHHSACMNSKHLLNFLRRKLEDNSSETVHVQAGTAYTLGDVLQDMRITKDNLLIDVLDTHATDTFFRFDRFAKKYNPYGKPVLREIFLKYDNAMKGKYLSEISKEVFGMQEKQKYCFSEYRISVYGRSADEWRVLSEWAVDNALFSTHIKWIIQVPRVYRTVRKDVGNFGEIVRNVFGPLFEASRDPDAHPKLARFLESVVAFDSVDDESVQSRLSLHRLPVPDAYTAPREPPYSYYLYYMYANIASLNAFRRGRGLNVFSFRPHSGEAGDPSNLVYAFLVSQSISHGLNLRKSSVAQYLYYVAQVGISMSPLSNNALFLRLHKNPFFDFFSKGLCVCLSTDDPLQFHFTKEPLAEEYSIATQFWMLSSCDQCEIARNSVLVSNFEDARKRLWLGESYGVPFAGGNDAVRTNVPDMRLRFREIALRRELELVGRTLSDIFRR